MLRILKWVILTLICLLLLSASRSSFAQASEDRGEQSSNVDYSAEGINLLLNANLAIQQKDYETAAYYYAILTKDYPEEKIAERATWLALRINDMDMAMGTATTWSELSPNNLYPQFLAATLLINHGSTNEAQPMISRIFQYHPESSAKTIEKIYFGLSNHKAHDGLFNLIKEYSVMDKSNTYVLYGLSLVAYLQNDNKLALKTISKVLEIKPDYSDAIALKARIILKNQNISEALVYLQNQLTLSHDDPVLKTVYATLLLQSHSLTQAKEQFQELLKITSQRPVALYNLAQIAYQEKDYDLATQYLKNYLSETSHTNSARYLLGKITEKQNRIGEAISWYESVKGGEHYINAHIHSALLIAKTIGVSKAISSLNKAMIATPEDYKLISIAKAQIYLDAKEPYSALSIVNDALLRLPNNPDLLFTRGIIYMNLTDFTSAERDFKEVLLQEPENKNASNALVELMQKKK